MISQKLFKLTSSSSTLVANEVILASSFLSRLKGLIGKESLPPSTALWIKNTNSIHTFFMRFPLDVIFVDRKLKVVAIKRNVKKNRMIFPVLLAAHVFEFSGGEVAEDLKVGDKLNVEN